MNRRCPSCKRRFNKRKRGACPICGVGIFYQNGDVRLTKDKQTVESLFNILWDLIYTRDGISIQKEQSELKYGYMLLDTAKEFIDKQPSLNVDYHKFVTEWLKWLIKNETWWAMNLNSLRMLIRSRYKMMADYARLVKKETERFNAEQQRI